MQGDQIIYHDEAMTRLVTLADKVARSGASVLITGPSGTGKEVMARYIHARSPRAGRPFISVNCAAIPEALLESELFGHERGAFTGAHARRIGKFEQAQGGTLLLDEISEMEAGLQAKLLRALQERMIERIGGSQPVPVDIRVIATSNRDLSQAVREGRFRADLLYRLNVVTLELPPLAKRRSDIPLLAEHFVAAFAHEHGLPRRTLSGSALAKLAAHSWPGNVRELENVIYRAMLFAEGETITAGEICLSGSGMGAWGGRNYAQGQDGRAGLVGRTLADVERELILETLRHCGGNRTHASDILGISVRTLRNKIRQYLEEGVPVPSYSRAA